MTTILSMQSCFCDERFSSGHKYCIVLNQVQHGVLLHVARFLTVCIASPVLAFSGCVGPPNEWTPYGWILVPLPQIPSLADLGRV